MMQSVQVMRGLAAIAVVFFHTHVILSHPEYGSITAFGLVATKGWLGVNFFFALSGFIILSAHEKDIGLPRRVFHYFSRRVTRVYPIYWVLLTFFIITASYNKGHPNFKWEMAHLATAYTLLELVDMPTLPLKVAWTLLFEVKFYLVFAFLILSRRLGLAIMLFWGIAILIRNAFTPLPDWGYLAPDWGMLNIWNINFLFGMIACWSLRFMTGRRGTWLLAIGLLTLVSSTHDVANMDSYPIQPVFMTIVACAFSLIIVGAVACEKHYSLEMPYVLKVLGNASYSIYLVHSAALSLLAGINMRFFYGQAPDQVVFVTFFVISAVAGVVVHFVAERPLQNLLRNMVRSPGRTSAKVQSLPSTS